MQGKLIGSVATLGTLCLLAGCGGASSSGQAAADTATKPECTSTADGVDYSGFSGGQIAEFAKKRDSMLDADKADDPDAWHDGAVDFATYFLDQIGLQPMSICSNNYKNLQSLMSAEMDFEARSPDVTKNPLSKEQTADYIKVLYQTAGLTEERGASHLDTKVQQTIDGITNTRGAWGK